MLKNYIQSNFRRGKINFELIKEFADESNCEESIYEHKKNLVN